jgi:hypothetical protein
MVRRTARILAQGLALVVVLFLAMLGTDFRTTPIDRPPPSGTPARAALGAFLGSDAGGVAAIDDFAAWLGVPVTVGHTYLPGNGWDDIEGPDWVVGPWSRWLRAAPGQAIDWARCYPGDDVVDIVGMDSYDQRPGSSFQDYIDQPGGLRAQAEFAAQHGKPISFPEWGLFDYGDDPQYVQGMHDWIASHDVVYQTITDYCPHGVWQCAGHNPKASARYRALFGTGS